MEYTKLSLSEVGTALEDVARDARETFGRYSAPQLNWQPDSSRWSVAQCLEHLLTANTMMFEAAGEALDESRPRSVWQRLPVLPRLFGPIMVRSMAPDAERKFKAPAKARPAASAISGDVVQRFIAQQIEAATRARVLDEGRAARTVMSSPFVKAVTYSVLDGWRLIVAHDHRHVEQARRVTQAAGFPTQ